MTAISSVEFLILLLVVASVIAVAAKRLRVPYTVALVAGGLLLSLLRLPFLSPLQPSLRPNWLTPDVILILFLPALIFEGSVKLDRRDLLRNASPLLILANVGVLLATLITGYLVHWALGLPMLVALLFGAIISATDPISVLAIFKDLRMSKRLSVIIEGESLLNDGTAFVLFQILLAAIEAGRTTVGQGIAHYVLAVVGGGVIGAVLGYIASRITRTIDDPEIEITLTTIVAYGSYLVAYHLHWSGVIATACAGLMVGNYGAKKRHEPADPHRACLFLGVPRLPHELAGVPAHRPGSAYRCLRALLAPVALRNRRPCSSRAPAPSTRWSLSAISSPKKFPRAGSTSSSGEASAAPSPWLSRSALTTRFPTACRFST